MTDIKIPLLIVLGFITTVCTWVSYRLLLFITGSSVPFTTLKVEVISFLPIFIGITISLVLLLVYIKVSGAGEDTKQEAILKFGLYESRFRITSLKNIEKQIDPKAKERLDKYALDLRRERESLTSENMQRSDGSFVKDWREVLLVARRRLVDEEYRLSENSKVNREGALSLAFIGVALPVYYIFFISEAVVTSNLWTILVSYWPIFTVVLVFEIIAGFFLRAYIQTEHKIERKQNEITNVELRLTSGLMLFEKTNADKFSELAETLSKDERNFVLNKNESSAITDIDKADIDRAVEIATKIIKATK